MGIKENNMKQTPTEQKELALDDFFVVIDKEQKLIEQLRMLDTTWQKNFLNRFLLEKVPQWDGKGMHAIFNAIQRQYGLDLGFCPDYEADLREEFKRAQATENYTGVDGFCWRYMKSEAKCSGLGCPSNNTGIIILIE